MKGSILVNSQWIRKQWRSRGCSCVKTSGCITTMPLCSRLLALNYVSAHSSQIILWIAILGCCVRTRRTADCWQRALAYNLSLPIGSACSIRGRKGAEADVGGGGILHDKKKNRTELYCRFAPVSEVWYRINWSATTPFTLLRLRICWLSGGARSKRINWHKQVPDAFCHATVAVILINPVANLSFLNLANIRHHIHRLYINEFKSSLPVCI